MQTDQDQRSSWMVSAAFCVAFVSLLAAIVLSKVQAAQTPPASTPAKSEPYAKSQKPASVKDIVGQKNDAHRQYAQQQTTLPAGHGLS
jgi:L,D-peptidoglycan transpeptidase YkuD (ErfK/YbiS/YcfS/YnhG family)